MEEIWKDITGYEGHYQVSNLGSVKSLKKGNEMIMKPGINSMNYKLVILSKNNKIEKFTIHQLVAIEFLGHQPNGNKSVIDHINGDTLNNTLENLRIVTQRENISLGYDKKSTSSKYRGVYWQKTSNKWLVKIYTNGKSKYLGFFDKEYDAANAYKEALNKINRLS